MQHIFLSPRVYVTDFKTGEYHANCLNHSNAQLALEVLTLRRAGQRNTQHRSYTMFITSMYSLRVLNAEQLARLLFYMDPFQAGRFTSYSISGHFDYDTTDSALEGI